VLPSWVGVVVLVWLEKNRHHRRFRGFDVAAFDFGDVVRSALLEGRTLLLRVKLPEAEMETIRGGQP